MFLIMTQRKYSVGKKRLSNGKKGPMMSDFLIVDMGEQIIALLLCVFFSYSAEGSVGDAEIRSDIF
jgi:hypothetical protein